MTQPAGRLRKQNNRKSREFHTNVITLSMMKCDVCSAEHAVVEHASEPEVVGTPLGRDVTSVRQR